MRAVHRIGEDETVTRSAPVEMPVEDMLDILRMTIRMEPLELILQRIVDTIAKAFGIRCITLGLLDEKTGLYVPKALHGYPPERAVSIRRNAYTLDRMKTDLRNELKIGRACYYVRAEDQTTSYDDEPIYILNPELVDAPRQSPSDWHELDYIDYVLTDRLGKWIGWIEVDEPADRKVPSREKVDGIQLLADLASLAIEYDKSYNLAIEAISDSQAYLDFIVHDIGGKITPMSYFLNTLATSSVSEERKLTSIENAVGNLASMKDMVDNVRKYSEVRTSITLPRHRYDLKEVLSLCARSAKRSRQDREIEIRVECEEPGCQVMADELIFDLFSNILNHSIEDTPWERVELDVRILTGHSAVTVRIDDNSRGVPDSRKTQIFKRFTWRPNGDHGADLGLSIVALLVERYNGLIEIKDKVPGDPGKGASYEVSLPMLRNQDESAQWNA